MASQNQTKTGLLAGPARYVPADLLASVILVGLVNLAMILPVVRGSWLRAVVGIPFVLFVPGYVLLAVLFPASPEVQRANASVGGFASGGSTVRAIRTRGITMGERAALSLGASLVLLPILGLALALTPWGFSLQSALAALSAFVVVAAIVAAVRRLSVPEGRRFAVPYRRWLGRLHGAVFDTESRGDAIVNLALVVGVLLMVSSVGYAIAAPSDGEASTNFALLSENESGDLVAGGYPTEFTQGEGQPMHVLVENDEGEAVDYTVVLELQRVRTGEDATTTVVEERQLTTMTVSLQNGESWRAEHTVRPTMSGENLRLTYHLYRGEPPADPSSENSYYTLYHWITVSG